MAAHIPSPEALESDDDGLLAAELRRARLRSQIAVVRTIADHVERLAQLRDAESVGAQVVEEMGVLGCRLREAVAALTEARSPANSAV